MYLGVLKPDATAVTSAARRWSVISTVPSQRHWAARSSAASTRRARCCRMSPSSASACVSRTALREAYSLLTGKALIIAPPARTPVRPCSDWPTATRWPASTDWNEQFVVNLFELRQMVEPAAAAATARLANAETISKISAAFADMERYQHGIGDLIAADLEFHMAILAGSGNPLPLRRRADLRLAG